MSKRERSNSSSNSGNREDFFGSSPSDDDELNDNDVGSALLDFAKNTATAASKSVTSSPNTNTNFENLTKSASEKAAEALKKFKEELLKPVSDSTALVAFNVAEESAEAVNKMLSSKVPKPTAEQTKQLRKLKYVDHSTCDYIEIRKKFYVAPPDVRDLSPEEVKALLKELDGAKIKGKNPPRPMRTWHGSGVPDKVLDVLEKKGFQNPFAVQSIGCPVLMCGRDLLVTAKTGTGKTLSYALPLVRHCIDQPRCRNGEGPIGLVLVPTQELAVQVYELLSSLCTAASLRCVASYGSTSLADNIKETKSGCEVMVCTPGRLLDLLTVNGGKTVSLFRTSFVVVDEADRLFDSGFMEHVEAFLKNIRPDRQLALISATLPPQLRKIILRYLNDPIEISVGGNSAPTTNVEQSFYFFDEEVYDALEDEGKKGERFRTLLRILGEEDEDKSLILIFVQRKEEVVDLMAELSALGYDKRIATLYSGMDPIDREFALEHFAPGKQYILIATAIAERGLDIPFLELVINYTLPNHYEAYVHRIGRTGRAGRKGRAVSFFTRAKDDDIAPELLEGLEKAGQTVPMELEEIAANVRELRKEGLLNKSVGFYRGYRKAKKMKIGSRDHKDQLRQAAKASGLEDMLSSSSDDEVDSDLESAGDIAEEIVPVETNQNVSKSSALTMYKGGTVAHASSAAVNEAERVKKALEFAEKTTDVVCNTEKGSDVRFQSEYPINDLPNLVRKKLQRGSSLRSIAEKTGATIVKKGFFFDPKKKHSFRMKEGEKPLYLLVIGRDSECVREARRCLDEIRDEMLERTKKKSTAIGSSI